MSWTRFQAGFDIHGDMADPASNRVFFKFAETWKPKIRICGGDLWDFRSLRKGANEEERRESLWQDFKAGRDWFHRFRPTHFTLGNHDQRIWDGLEKGGTTADLCAELVDKVGEMVARHETIMFPYDKRKGIVRISAHLKVLHGYFSGNLATRHHALTYGSCLFGHVHTIEEFAVPGLERRVAKACGALCKLDMPYNSKMPGSLRHANGFAYGVVNSKTGHYHVWQAECVESSWVLPSDIVTYSDYQMR
jgi:hypothetical protein